MPYPNPMAQNNLNQAVNQHLAAGWRVESSTPGQVVLVRGDQVNHVLHALLTLFLLGLWLIVWLIVAATNKQERIILSVDYGTGQVHRLQG